MEPYRCCSAAVAVAGNPRSPSAMQALPEEVVGEILVRFPPADPGSLLRAALVCKPSCRIVCGRSFRRRFMEFHRVAPAPLLGFLCNTPSEARFVPTSSFRPPHADDLIALHDCDKERDCCLAVDLHDCEEERDYLAVDARHGLVLLCFVDVLVVWDPTTDQRWEVSPVPDICGSRLGWHAAVLRAPTANGHHDGNGNGNDTPFVVVRVVTESSSQRWCLRVYSSEDASWSEQTLLPQCRVDGAPTALVGNTLYFMTDSGTRVLSFDLATRETSVIHLPPKAAECATALMEMEVDGGLGFASVDEFARLSLWSMEVNPNGDMGWTQTRVIELEKLIPISHDFGHSSSIGLAHAGGVFFMVAFNDGLFRFDLKSGRVRKVHEVDGGAFGYIGRDPCVVPYTGFCTPVCHRY